MTNSLESTTSSERRTHPSTIDISMTGACQLDCQWCWGEVHDIGVEHQQDEWKSLLTSFNERGTNAVVFTGGEPLMVPFLPEVAEHAKRLGMRTTLSTNAILLAAVCWFRLRICIFFWRYKFIDCCWGRARYIKPD